MYLVLLKWVRDQGCPWDKETCRSAAYQGKLKVLKYLHDNGCSWDEMACQEERLCECVEVSRQERLYIG
jgi:hypothetical protein